MLCLTSLLSALSKHFAGFYHMQVITNLANLDAWILSELERLPLCLLHWDQADVNYVIETFRMSSLVAYHSGLQNPAT